MPTEIYTITHKCGHFADRKITDTTRNSIDMKADTLEKQVCPACYKARQQTKVSDVLPTLIGSEKQVAWAMSLRNQIIVRTDKFIAEYERHHGNELDSQLRGDRTKMVAHPEAKFWIENREGLKALERA